jgi:hypothetical protein
MYSTCTIIRDCRDPYLSAQNVKAWRDRYSLRVEVYPGGVHAFCISIAAHGGRMHRVMGFDPFNPGTLSRLSTPCDSSAEAWQEARARLAAEGWHVPGPTAKLRAEGLANYPIAVRKPKGSAPTPPATVRREGNGEWTVQVYPHLIVPALEYHAVGLPGTAQPLSFTGIRAPGLVLGNLTAKPIAT